MSTHKSTNLDFSKSISKHLFVTITPFRKSSLVIGVRSGKWIVASELERHLTDKLLLGNSPYDVLMSAIIEYPLLDSSSIFESLLSLIERLIDISFEHNHTYKPSLFINITNRCNLKCTHCLVDAPHIANKSIPSDILSTQDIFNIIDQYTNVVSKGEITLSGGEPLIRKDIIEICEHIRKKGHHLTMFTNGTLINKRNFAKLSSLVDELQISLDGATSEGNDTVRGKGTYRKVINAIELISDLKKTKIAVAVTITPSNYYDLLENSNFLSEIAHKYKLILRISAMKPEGRAKKEFSQADYDQLVELSKRITHEINGAIVIDTIDYFGNPINSCGFGECFYISHQGDIYPCKEDDEFHLGNIRTTPIDKLYKNLEELHASTSVDKSEQCVRCDIKYCCGGSCRIANKLKRGNLNKNNCSKEIRYNHYLDMLSGGINQ